MSNTIFTRRHQRDYASWEREDLKTFVERIKRKTSANEAIVRKADIQADK